MSDEYVITVVQPDRCTGHEVKEFKRTGTEKARKLVRALADGQAFSLKIEMMHEGVLVPMPVQELFS